MTGRIAFNPPALGRALALVIVFASSTTRADPAGSPIIPGEAPKSDEASSSAPASLPLPYEAWQGRGYAPAGAVPAGDVPAPLARPRELPRRPFETTLAAAAFLPSCAAGSIDDRGCITIQPGGGLEGALLYRVGSFFAVGLEGSWSGFGGQGHGSLSGAGGSARFVGVVGRVYFADSGLWDPYVSLTLGYGALRLREAAAAQHGDSSGFGARVAGGLDFLLGSHLRLGPTLGFAHFVAWHEQGCNGAVCRDQPRLYGRLLGFGTLGIRATASFGDAL